MRRRSEESLGSLELMLDTICNMFGGILLMAILVVVMTQSGARGLPAPPVQEDAAIEARSLDGEIQRLEDQLAELRVVALSAARQYASEVPPVIREMLQRREAFAEAGEAAIQRLQQTTAHRQEAAAELATLERQIEYLDSASRAGQAELDRLKRQLVAAPAALPVNVRLPHRRGRVEGQPLYFLIRGQTAYRLGLVRWLDGPHDSLDCRVEPDAFGRSARIRPRQGAGLEIPAKPDQAGALSRYLASNSPRSHYVVMFVYDDTTSYGSFQRVKQMALQMGYHYVVETKSNAGDYFPVRPVSHHESE